MKDTTLYLFSLYLLPFPSPLINIKGIVFVLYKVVTNADMRLEIAKFGQVMDVLVGNKKTSKQKQIILLLEL